MGQASAIRRSTGFIDPYSGLNLGEAVLQNAPVAYHNALQRDQKVSDDKDTAENTRQFNADMGLRREAMDRTSEDSKRASVIGGVQAFASMPGWSERVFGDSGTKESITADARDPVHGNLFKETGFADSLRRDVSEYTGESAASGLSLKGLGQAGVGALAGGLIGGNDLERAAIGAGVRLAWNIGEALMSDTISVVDGVTSSLFPSIGGAIGAVFGF